MTGTMRELHTRLGLARGVTFPRVPGIEAVGAVPETLQTAYGGESSGLPAEVLRVGKLVGLV